MYEYKVVQLTAAISDPARFIAGWEKILNTQANSSWEFVGYYKIDNIGGYNVLRRIKSTQSA